MHSSCSLPATVGVEHVAGSLPTADKVVALAATPRLNNDADMFMASFTSLHPFQYFSINFVKRKKTSRVVFMKRFRSALHMFRVWENTNAWSSK